jgi:hypothetical protein
VGKGVGLTVGLVVGLAVGLVVGLAVGAGVGGGVGHAGHGKQVALPTWRTLPPKLDGVRGSAEWNGMPMIAPDGARMAVMYSPGMFPYVLAVSDVGSILRMAGEFRAVGGGEEKKSREAGEVRRAC